MKRHQSADVLRNVVCGLVLASAVPHAVVSRPVSEHCGAYMRRAYLDLSKLPTSALLHYCRVLPALTEADSARLLAQPLPSVVETVVDPVPKLLRALRATCRGLTSLQVDCLGSDWCADAFKDVGRLPLTSLSVRFPASYGCQSLDATVAAAAGFLAASPGLQASLQHLDMAHSGPTLTPALCRSVVTSCERLTALDLAGTAADDSCFVGVAATLPALQSLDLSGAAAVTETTVAELAPLRRLHTLSFGKRPVTQAVAEAIARLPQLECLVLKEASVADPDDLSPLRPLVANALRELTLGVGGERLVDVVEVLFPHSAAVVEEAAAALRSDDTEPRHGGGRERAGTGCRLRQLTLVGRCVSFTSAVAAAMQLRLVETVHLQLRLDDLAPFSLRDAATPADAVRHSALAAFALCPALRTVSLEEATVDDVHNAAVLLGLRRCAQLDTVVLRGLDVGLSSLGSPLARFHMQDLMTEALLGLPPQLTTLDASHTHLSDNVIAKVRKASGNQVLCPRLTTLRLAHSQDLTVQHGLRYLPVLFPAVVELSCGGCGLPKVFGIDGGAFVDSAWPHLRVVVAGTVETRFRHPQPAA